MTLRVGLPLAALLVLLVPVARGDDAGFRDRVAPILERRCLSCHGEAKPKGGLSLQTRAGVLKGGESGPAVDAANPDESPLLEAVTGARPAMPKSGEPLAKGEVDALRAWVKAGAPWPDGPALVDRRFEGETWWSFRPLVPPPVPTVSDANKGRVRTPIDAFLLKRLEDEGMPPSPEADRRTLIRRLAFDLTGLPPTPGEVDAFVRDDRTDAYESLVERLLASPAYGERWARHWLDVAHYGDTHGYDKDKRRDNAWRYRDYVVDAFNADTPYARFVREQIAGDVLAPGDVKGAVAVGFLAAGPWDFVGHVELREGTVDKEKTRLIDRDDMLTNVLTTFDSLTVGCARCHDHKFDPIPQRDYYRLQAVFAGVDRGDRAISTGEGQARRAELERAEVEARRKLRDAEEAVEARIRPVVADLDARIEAVRNRMGTLPPTSRRGEKASRTNGFHSAIFPRRDAVAWATIDLGRSYPIDEIRLVPARPVDFPDTPGFGFPRSYRVLACDRPGFDRDVAVLAERRIDDDAKVPDEPVVLRPKGASARYVRIVADRLWRRTGDYVFALSEAEILSGGVNRALGAAATASDAIEAGRWSTKHLVDGFDSRFARPEAGDADAKARHDLLFALADLNLERAAKADAATSPELKSARETAAFEVARIAGEVGRLPSGPSTYSVKPRAPRPIRVLARGDVEKPGEAVGPGALSCLKELPSVFPDTPDEGARRAALADWVARPDNPLTWRSIVNRVWHHHVGRGIVDTPSDFGRNGSRPTHPELLDWLACGFRDGGGSFKALHRLIVTSSFYRQSSAVRPEFAAKDADNRLLWRMNRRRLEAEAVRDAVLAVAGTLDPRRGGPAFEPFRFKDDHSPIYDHLAIDRILAPENRRRSIYRFTVRSVPHPFLECLDSADPNTPTPARSTTVTALQALALWNNPFMLAQAEAFAARAGEGGTEPEASVANAVRIAFGRDPRPDERAALAALARSRGLAEVCRVLLNANEFLFVD